MDDKPQTFLTVVDKTSVHSQVLHGVAIRVRSFEFTTGDYSPSDLLGLPFHVIRHDPGVIVS